jgi:hypothetical protein
MSIPKNITAQTFGMWNISSSNENEAFSMEEYYQKLHCITFTFLLLLLLWCSLDLLLGFFSLSLLLLLSLWWWRFFVFPSGCSNCTGDDSTVLCVRTGSFSSSRRGLQNKENN